MNVTSPVIKKVPGNVAQFQHEKDGYIESLTLKTNLQLGELLERQNKLISKRSFLEKLPDKGHKIKLFREKILTELSKRKKDDGICGMFSNLDIGNTKEADDDFEWNGKCNASGLLPKISQLNIDDGNDEQTNLLKILVTHSGTSVSKNKQKIVEQPETTSLVKKSDTESNINITNQLSTMEIFATRRINSSEQHKYQGEKKFHMNKVLKPQDPLTGVKTVTLQESIVLYHQQTEKQKEMQMEQANNRLAKRLDLKLRSPTNGTEHHREIFDHDEEGEDDDGTNYLKIIEEMDDKSDEEF